MDELPHVEFERLGSSGTGRRAIQAEGIQRGNLSGPDLRSHENTRGNGASHPIAIQQKNYFLKSSAMVNYSNRHKLM